MTGEISERTFSAISMVCAYFSKKEYMVKDDFLGVFGWIGWREKCGREIGEKEMKIKQNSKEERDKQEKKEYKKMFPRLDVGVRSHSTQ